MEFSLYRGGNDWSREVVHTETLLTEYFNLKSKAEVARRIGYSNQVVKYTNAQGEIAYRAELQTTLNGSRYQSSKYGVWRATAEECKADLKKTVASATKRYAKLALDPAKNKIEHRA
ncbi:hypothetical protein [Bradyrhizobium sp. S3.7.6]